MSRLSPYERIMRCARNGTGCRLTADEVAALAEDSAIYYAAENHEATRKGEPEPCGPVIIGDMVIGE